MSQSKKFVNINVFVSSPADVSPERDVAERVVGRINGIYVKNIHINLHRWERSFFQATKSFQEGIATMDGFDLVVGIFWKRMGTELPPGKFRRADGSSFESGTAYELESAIAAGAKNSAPDVYVFKKTAQIFYSESGVDEERRQKTLLEKWWNTQFRDDSGHYVAGANNFSDTDDFEDRFEQFLVEWLIAKGHISKGPVWSVTTQGSPYPGLLAYEQAHSDVFFGRDYAIEQSFEELVSLAGRSDRNRALFVIGASGSGKSSLIKAGLVPRLLSSSATLGLSGWRIASIEPVADVFSTLGKALYSSHCLPELRSGAQKVSSDWAKIAATSAEGAVDAIVWALDSATVSQGGSLPLGLILVLDQLENLFSVPMQSEFCKLLRELATTGRVVLLMSIRSDRYTQLQDNDDLLFLKRTGATFDLPSPGTAEIREVIRAPARAAGLQFELDGEIALSQVLERSSPGADSLPLLQMTLALLFETRRGNLLTYDSYRTIGGIEGAIAAHANLTFSKASHGAQKNLKNLIKLLVRDVNRRSDGSIRFMLETADRGHKYIGKPQSELIDVLIEGRLLISDQTRIRIAHEALVRRWELAFHILCEIADAEIRRLRLRYLTMSFASAVFVSLLALSVYLSSVAVTLFLQSKENLTSVLVTTANQYIIDDRPTHAYAMARQLEQQIADNGPFGLIASYFSIENELDVRLSSFRRVSADAVAALNWQHIEASPVTSIDRSEAAGLMVAGYRDGKLRLFQQNGDVKTIDLDRGPILLVRFGANSSILFVATDREIVRWDIGAKTADTLCASSGEITDLALSSDGRFLAWSTKNRAVTLMDTETTERRVFLDHSKWVLSVSFSGDGKTFVSTGDDGVAVLRDVETGGVRQRINVIDKDVWSSALSANGRRLFTAAISGNVRAWSVSKLDQDGTKLLGPSKGKRWRLRASSYDDKIAITSWDGTVSILDENSLETLFTLDGHDGRVNDVFFAEDDDEILTGTDSGYLRSWNVSKTRQMFQDYPTGAGEIIVGLYNLTGNRFAAGGNDGFVRLFDVRGSKLKLRCIQNVQDWVIGVAFSWRSDLFFALRTADIKRSGQPVISVFETSTCRKSAIELPVTEYVSSLASSPSGTKLAWGTASGRLDIYDYSSGNLKSVVLSAGVSLTDMVFDADGKRVAAVTSNGDVFLIDVISMQYKALRVRQRNYLNTVRFNPAGDLLAVGGAEPVIRIWSTLTPDVGPIELSIPGGTNNLAFSSDGTSLAAGSDALYIAKWRTGTWKRTFVLSARVGIRSVYAFNPQTADLAYDAGDGVIRVLAPATNVAPDLMSATLKGPDILFDEKNQKTSVWKGVAERIVVTRRCR